MYSHRSPTLDLMSWNKDGKGGQKSENPENSEKVSSPEALEFKYAKTALALKIAGSIPTEGTPSNIIHAFIKVNDYDGLTRYLSKFPVGKDVFGFALQKACIASNSEAIDFLSTHGGNANFVDQFGTTLLHCAMRGGGKPLVIISLLKHGMQYQSWRCDGQSLLHWAAQWGHLPLVR